MSLDLLIDEVRLAVEGRPLTGRWQKERDPERRQWLGGKSNNIPRLAEACHASVDPVAAADWWSSLLVEEWGEGGFWDAQECGGRTYGGATWGGELGALSVFRRVLPGQPVIRLLERSLTRRAAWYSLTGVSAVTRLGARGQVTYLGLGSLTTGGRSNHFENHDADDVMQRVLTDARPSVELQPNAITRLLDTIMRRGGPGWSGVDELDRERLRVLVATEGTDLELVGHAVRLLGPARTLAPLWVRRYQDGTLGCGVDWNPSSETSCAFLVASKTDHRPLRLRDQVVFLHPYGSHGRVRGGTGKGRAFLGRGETWWEGDTFACANLTREDAARREGGERWELRHELPPASTVVWELRTSPDAPPRLSVGGHVVTPPAPPKPPGPPQPPKPPPGPPPSGRLRIPPKGWHVVADPPGEEPMVIRLHEDRTWEEVRPA